MLTILFAPYNVGGHINTTIAVGEVLLKRGHRIVIAASKLLSGKFTKLGFEEIYYDFANEMTTEDWTGSFVKETAPYLPLSPLEQHKAYGKGKKSRLIQFAKNNNDLLDDIVEKIKPDIIIIDQLAVIPSLVNKPNIPWIRLVSSQVLILTDCIDNGKFPPQGSGLSINGPKEEWKHYSDECEKLYADIWSEWNDWVIAKGASPLPYLQLIPLSPYANLYMYPLEIDYNIIPDKFHRFDNFCRSGKSDESIELKIPNDFLQKSGKLIYFSMGSIACVDLSLMIRLLNILKKSPNKFIVSKGPLSDKIQLYDNMFGAETLPQTKVLEMVDLVITHGGNNTTNETFYYGKPLLIMPIYSDQFDNAQRVYECGYGSMINAYFCTETELLNTIEQLLYNEEIKERMTKAGKRIRDDQIKDHNRLAEVIENVVK